jgi:transposase
MHGSSFVGIDVSKASLDVALRCDGHPPVTHRFNNDRDGIEALIAWVDEYGAQQAIIVVESTGSLHWLLCLLLVDSNHDVRLINPLLTKKYQRSSIRNAKTDRIDALRLADIARIEDDLPPFFDSRETLQGKRCQALLDQLEHAHQQLKRSYRDAMEALTTIDMSMDLSCMEDCVQSMEEAIKIFRSIIENRHDPLADAASSIAGVSRFQAAVLSMAVQGRTFDNRDQLIAFFGLDVRVRQSGTWQGQAHLSKRGNPFHRKILFQLGWSLWRNNPTYAAYYDSLRKRNKHYFTALLATARKFLRHFFSLYQQYSLVPAL